ncbi:hypothetical protein DIZ81_13865 [Legionella taurinensis]|uniref:Uncharacterized protein n=1 Tax=Legionella taurinensis TaxID=70611 RepID=A0AB38N3B5_9GAMM|nr:hypothetical protein [Legionella taurinensis]PUT38578.1 hypothetical protein DB744_13875 [Legionella taurinensis]PUT39341.1 hypothetical protein DB746_13825 [Legionella taurinensis]PUT41613.1 hypothetical protein DB743_13750 [Legionella taurinensis]PUT44650.1 hypothetical protein DB745_13825 [Legionella taurinensis]TID31466.1 hypothetical protein DIZ41_13750 [Legionella taurinensis]
MDQIYLQIGLSLVSGIVGVIFALFWNSYNQKVYFSRVVVESGKNGTSNYPYLVLTNVGERVVTFLELSGSINKDGNQIPLFDKTARKIILDTDIPPKSNIAFRFNSLFDDLVSKTGDPYIITMMWFN